MLQKDPGCAQTELRPGELGRQLKARQGEKLGNSGGKRVGEFQRVLLSKGPGRGSEGSGWSLGVNKQVGLRGGM